MAKNLVISILAVFLVGTIADRAVAGNSKRAKLLIDGSVLTGIDGKLTTRDSNEGSPGRWFFKFDSDLSGDKGRVHAGETIELLPSAALEKIIANAGKHSDANYRLWGRVTRYKGRNFIFPIYFLPLSKVRQQDETTAQKSQSPPSDEPTINEPNDALAIPQEIIDKLAARRTLTLSRGRPAQLLMGSRLELKQDFILADRTGFIRAPGYGIRDTGRKARFVLDALGRNVQQISFRLLPCEVMERALQQQSAEPNPVRFKIAGILTQYKGDYYLLLQRAIRVYSHGNFGR